MKNQRNFWQTLKQHSRRITVTTSLASSLLLSWNAAQAEPSAVANSNDESHVSVGVPSEQAHLALLSQVDSTVENISPYPVKAARVAGVQLFADMPLSGLQANAFSPDSVLQYVPDYVTKQKSRSPVKDDSSWVMFSW